MATSCDRARLWAALVPDDTVSEIEQRLLDAHLERCVSCRAFSADVAAFTDELRAAPGEPLSLRLPAFRAPRRRAAGVLQFMAVAAVAATVVATPILVGPVKRSDRRVPSLGRLVIIDASSADSDTAQVLRELRDYSHARTALESDVSPRGRPGPIAG